MISVKLIRLASNHSNLRTSEIIGETVELPSEGKEFVLFGEPIDITKDIRIVHTTPIQTVEKLHEKLYQFTTANSTYRLELL